MTITVNDFIKLYDGIEYLWTRGAIFRPRELNIPILLFKQDETFIQELKQSRINSGKGIQKVLNLYECKAVAPILLHESIFHLYKAFYNYLAARSLYFSGMSHWVDITLYYSKFYLARSITTLAGRQSYVVRKTESGFDNPHFMKDVAQELKPNKEITQYSVRSELDLLSESGVLKFDTDGVKSHPEVWGDYEKLEVENLGLYNLSYDPPYNLSAERNRENYSFEGYFTLDFNLEPNSFEQSIQTDYLKSYSDIIYDETSGEVLLAISTSINFLKKLGVPGLPIENEKFASMISYYLPESKAKEKLLKLCEEGFPTESLTSKDGGTYYDQRGKTL